MGLFGKKEKIPDGIRVMYYEGELKEFPANQACQLLLMDDILRITKIKPFVEVKLERSRIFNLEILGKNAYMQKYKGTSANELKKDDIIQVSYYVINYMDKNGNSKHLDFWGTSAETLKMMKIRESLMSDKQSTSYEI